MSYKGDSTASTSASTSSNVDLQPEEDSWVLLQAEENGMQYPSKIRLARKRPTNARLRLCKRPESYLVVGNTDSEESDDKGKEDTSDTEWTLPPKRFRRSKPEMKHDPNGVGPISKKGKTLVKNAQRMQLANVGNVAKGSNSAANAKQDPKATVSGPAGQNGVQQVNDVKAKGGNQGQDVVLVKEGRHTQRKRESRKRVRRRRTVIVYPVVGNVDLTQDSDDAQRAAGPVVEPKAEPDRGNSSPTSSEGALAGFTEVDVLTSIEYFCSQEEAMKTFTKELEQQCSSITTSDAENLVVPENSDQ